MFLKLFQRFKIFLQKRPPDSLIITHVEVCDKHGTGALLLRLFAHEKNLINIRSHNHFGENHLGDLQLLLQHNEVSPQQAIRAVRNALRHRNVRRILCVPFYPDELRTAIAAAEAYEAPLCVYIMDDQNVFIQAIPDDLMREALTKAKLRLAISPQLREAYEKKYDLPFWLLSPVVSGHLFANGEPDTVNHERPRGVLIGNIWNQKILGQLRTTMRSSGAQIDWFGNAGRPFLQFDDEELKRDGITHRGHLKTEEELAARLRKYDYAILPSSMMNDPDDEHYWLAKASLPSRLVFIMAAANLPIIVLGSPETAAAQFVVAIGIGESCSYDPAEFQNALRRVTTSPLASNYRKTAREQSRIFSSDGIGDWIWQSLQQGYPIDDRFETLRLNHL